MDDAEAQVRASIDEALHAAMIGAPAPRTRLVRRCRAQAAIAAHLNHLHEDGVITGYRMPCVHEDRADTVVLHISFDTEERRDDVE